MTASHAPLLSRFVAAETSTPPISTVLDSENDHEQSRSFSERSHRNPTSIAGPRSAQDRRTVLRSAHAANGGLLNRESPSPAIPSTDQDGLRYSPTSRIREFLLTSTARLRQVELSRLQSDDSPTCNHTRNEPTSGLHASHTIPIACLRRVTPQTSVQRKRQNSRNGLPTCARGPVIVRHSTASNESCIGDPSLRVDISSTSSVRDTGNDELDQQAVRIIRQSDSEGDDSPPTCHESILSRREYRMEIPSRLRVGNMDHSTTHIPHRRTYSPSFPPAAATNPSAQPSPR